jgi:hypothetical protein
LARLLVGRVSDPALGNLEATANFNFSPPIETQFPTPAASFVSLTLQLKFDYYAYGVMDSSDLQLQIFEILDQLTTDRVYFASTPVTTQPVAIGDTIIAPGPVELKDGWERNTNVDATDNISFTIPIKLSGAMGQMLLSDLQNNRGIFESFGEFSSKYPGLSVSMPAGNKILGFTPLYGLPTPGPDDSKLILKYVEGTTPVVVDFPIYYASVSTTSGNVLMPVVSFSAVSFDPTGGPLDGLLPFQDIHPSDNKMYVQSGTGLIGKFDFANFYTYFDTLKDVVINSAEMVLTNTSTFQAPQKLEMVLLDEQNNFRSIYLDTVNASGDPSSIKDPYLAKLEFYDAVALTAVSATDTRAVILNAISTNIVPVNQQTGEVGRTILTEFYQQILNEKTHPRRATAFSILPVDNEFRKTVSALNLNASSAVIRVYYSKPLTSLP